MELSQKQIMNRIYHEICGFEIPKTDERKVRGSKGSPIYGEITVTSTAKLFDALKINEKDVLYDLGSGVGKVVLYAGLFTKVKQAIGIELSEARHQDSLRALLRASDVKKNLDNRCQFHNADLLTIDLSKASVVYTCSTAFSREFMRTVTAFLGEFTHDFRLVSLQDLPNQRHFELIDVIKLDMSWQRKTPVHIYRRRQP